MSYRVLLVDDEPVIRKGIISSIDWQQEDIESWSEAANGKEALELIPEINPDILITDIRMPIMDGLKLVEEVKKSYPDIKIIILSGFDDFEYAQRAIKNGVESYLLKPVGAEQLVKEVKNLLEKIEAEREKKAVELRNTKLIREHYQSLKKAFTNDMLRGKFSKYEDLSGQAAALGLEISTGRWFTCVFSIDDFLLWSEIDSDLDQDSLRYLVLNVIEEVLQKHGRAFGTMGELDQLNVFVECCSRACSSDDSCIEITRYLEEIQKHVDNYLNCTLTIGIGRPVDNLLTIASSWKQALSAVRQKAYMGKAAIIHYQDKFDSELSFVEYPSEIERDIISQMRLGNREPMNEALSSYFDTLGHNRASSSDYRQHCQRLMIMSISGLEESGIDSHKLPLEQSNHIARLQQLETVADFEQHLKRYFDELLDIIQQSRDEKYTSFIRQTIDYVKNNYQEEISLASLAQAIHITPNYLSKLFKKETGVNFVDWLNQYRIDIAKELLITHPELKGYEISEQVGFHDYKYFTFVFKKYAGQTPRDFRS